MFGRLSAQRGERSVTNFRTEKTAMLLACLAQEPDRAIRRDELVEQLWPGQPQDVAHNRLRVVLSYLRSILEPEPEDRGNVLLADRREVRLSTSALTTDIAEFEASLLRADRMSDEPARIEALEAAITQYQAEFLHTLDAFWITAERLRLKDTYQLALRRLIQALLSQGQNASALMVAQKAVKADPYREETHRLLMLVYGKMGRPTAALRQYEELERLLDSRTGSSPSTETRDALARLSGPEPELPARNPGRPRIPVQGRKPQHVPLKTPPLPIPAPLSILIGREDAISQIVAMLETPETRLVNLMGVGGVGKTRLAIAVAEKIRGKGRPVCFLSLVGVENAEDISLRLAAALHVPLRPRPNIWDRLVETLADHAMLLVLDNVEHLLPQAALVVRKLLESCPSLSCLATSRQRLGVAGEYPYTVRPLVTPAPSNDPDKVVEVPSVRLWLDRARAASPGFQLTASNCRDVALLCRMLEGIPLALELAAAWADVLSPKQVAARLTARFDVLVGRDHRFEGRHASLRAALDGSYDRLAPAVQRFFARLGRFRSGWTLEAAEAVCHEPAALHYLAQLVERSLVTTEETEEGLRYGFLMTVRDYARLKLMDHDPEETDRAYFDYFSALADEASVALKSSESGVWMQRLKREEENVRAALALGLEDTVRPARLLQMCVSIYRYWYIDGDVAQGRRWLTAALALVSDDSPLRPKALTALGNLAYAQGDAVASEAYYTECLDLYKRMGDVRGVATTLGNLANLNRFTGQLPQAQSFAIECLNILQRLDDVHGVAMISGNLAAIARKRGDYTVALDYSEQAVKQFRKLEDPGNLAIALTNMSSIARRLGRFEESAAHLAECLDLCVERGARRDLGIVFTCTGILNIHMGAHAAAAQLLAAGEEMCRRLEITPPQDSRERLEGDLGVIRSAIGDDCLKREWLCGTQLTEEAAISIAKSCLDQAA